MGADSVSEISVERNIIEKKESWAVRVARYLEEVRHKEYCIGENDCYTFACDIFDLMTNRKISRIYEGRYNSLKEGLQIIKYNGGFLKLISDYLGRPNQGTYLDLESGDFVLFNYEGQEHLGIFFAYSIIHPSNVGLAFFRHIDVKYYWRI